MADLATCPLPELVAQFRKSADTANKNNDALKCLLMYGIASRFEKAHDEITELLGVLRECKREHVYHSWQAFNGKTEAEVREILDGS